MLRHALVTGTRAAVRSTTVRVPSASASQLFTASSQFQLQLQTAAAPGFRIKSAAATRWYSSDGNNNSKAEGAAKEGEAPEGSEEGDAATSELEALQKKLEAKDREIIDWKDKCLRSIADFRNLQERTSREMKSARDFAIQKFAKDLIDSVDNFDRALSTVTPDRLVKPADDSSAPGAEATRDLVGFHEGIKMTETVLMNTLQKHGLERFDPVGDKFDPNIHEATFMTPQPDKEEGSVFHVQQKGFKLNGRVLRAAKVGVVKNK